VTSAQAVTVVIAGFAAGAINAVAGAGTLVTFPVLLAVGLPPVVANVSNTVGLVPGSIAGAFGYRRELAGQRSRLVRLATGTALGAVLGGFLLLRLPSSVFRAVVPGLIVIACAMVVLQPQISKLVVRRHDAPAHGGAIVWLLVLLTGVYGGYFGAAQGIILLAVLGLGLDEQLQRVNALKNVLAGLANGVSALLFMVVADVDYQAAALVAAGSVLGGVVGGRYGRRLPVGVLRAIIVAMGALAIVRLL
jgi:uncharacterized protein